MSEEYDVTEDDLETMFVIKQSIGFSEYKALDVRHGTTVTIKIMDTEDQHAMDEVRWNNTLPNSSFLIRYNEIFRTDKGHIWMISDFCNLGSVRDIQKVKTPTLEEYQIKIIIKDVLCALNDLHSKNLIYSQLQASNIMLQTNNKETTEILIYAYIRSSNTDVPQQLVQLLCDFVYIPITIKLAALDVQSNNDGSFIGCPYWISPESIVSDQMTTKCDIWSLGITAIEMATGKPPHSDKPPHRVLLGVAKWDAPSLPLSNNWSDEFREFVTLCCTKDVDQRASVKALLKHDWLRNIKIEDIYEWTKYVQSTREEIEIIEPLPDSQYNTDTDTGTDWSGTTMIRPVWGQYKILIHGYIRSQKYIQIPEDIVTVFVMFFEMLYIEEEGDSDEYESYGSE